MARLLLVFLAFLVLGLGAGPSFGQEPAPTPRINPLTGKPYGPKAMEAYEAEIKRQKAEEEAAHQASEEAEQRWQEARARNAAQIKAFDDAIEDWQEDHPAPAGTREALVSTSYDNDTALGERAEITYYNGSDIPTHKVQFGPDGKPTGPVTQTQQGKVWETVGPRIPPGGGVEVSYGKNFDGDEIITRVHIFDAGNKSIQSYEFNFDGVPWRGVTRDPETGLRNGGFQDDRLKPPVAGLGGPLAVPAAVRLVTGVCEKCRALMEQHNDLANRINLIIAEMRSLSEQHQHAYPIAQKQIRMRYDVLTRELAALMAEFERIRAQVLECERTCGQTSTTGEQPDGPSLARPQFEPLPDLALPASFCSEGERVGYLNDVYNPAVAAALGNAGVAQDHQARLNALFTEHMRANSPYWGAVRAERDAFEAIAAESGAEAEGLRQMYATILVIPIVPCPDAPMTATGPQDPTQTADATSAGTGKPAADDCPPKQGRTPITVGPNSKVGSGAQLRSKIGGMATGALLGALGAGGGGGGSEPQLWTCKIKDSEYTVFNDPLTGVSLRVGAKRAKGGKVVIFSEIAKSPDKGTFQTAFLERPSTGETMAPSDIGPCDLWGEWKLTVSWTRTTYVNGQMTSQESGGWSEGGFFKIPGVLSPTAAPDGFWKQMGFSSAQMGAREMGMIFDMPPGGGPLTFVIHVTRPKGDPVTTVPFVLTMTEGEGGVFTFTKAEAEADCPPVVVNTVSTAPTPPAGKAQTPAAVDSTGQRPITPDNYWSYIGSEVRKLRELIDAGDKNPCDGSYEAALRQIQRIRKAIADVLGAGTAISDGGRQDISETTKRVDQIEAELRDKMAAAAKTPCPPPAPPTAPEDNTDSIMDEIDEVFVPA